MDDLGKEDAFYDLSPDFNEIILIQVHFKDFSFHIQLQPCANDYVHDVTVKFHT